MLSAGSSASDSRPAYSSLNGSGSSGGTLRPLSSFGLRPPVALAGLHLGPKLGSGSYGHVYRATMGSHMVAVKIIDSKVQPGDGAPTRAMLEALLSQQLQHPCIVRTLTSAWEDSAQGASEWSASEWGHSRWSVASDSASLRSLDSPLLSGVDDDEQCCIAGHPIQQMWIVQEYCDHGTLGDAIDRGWLRVRRDPDAPADLRAVLLTAQARRIRWGAWGVCQKHFLRMP
jgi:serine/threonine protein kinase